MIYNELEENVDRKWEYDPTKGRNKHRWKHDVAGFQNLSGNKVGKCPNGLRLSEAQELLDDAIADQNDEFDAELPYPKRVYNVYRGVPYEAMGDGRNNKYHGYPCNLKHVDDNIIDQLRQRAIANGHSKQFKKWERQYG